MNEQNNPQPIKPTQNSKNIWIIIISVIFITALIVGGGVYAWQRSVLKATEQSLQKQIDLLQKKVEDLNLEQTVSDNSSDQVQKTIQTDNSSSELPSLTADNKDITVDDKVLLSIDNNTIFDWFKNQSQLCDGYNLTSTPDRKDFCESKNIFKEKTKFKSIIVSPSGKEIGFTIESETLTPDTVVGIFSMSTNTVKLLTSYYLGNEFISFSPNGKYFVYKANCWEAMCGLFILDSKTLNEKKTINNPEFADYRMSDAEFIKWISDNEVEYRLNSINSDDVTTERVAF